jgi:predicted alpha/beta superfamily hydrolase
MRPHLQRRRTELAILIFIAASLVALATPSTASESTTVDPATALMPGGVEVRDVYSKAVGDSFRVFIGRLPGSGEVQSQDSDSPQKVPVIYLLDGNGMFLDVLQMARWLSRSGDVRPAVVVGIGYPMASFWDTMNLRSRDYTPTADPGLMAIANRTMWPGLADAKTAVSGGADAFLDFIESELMPMIEEENHGSVRLGATSRGLRFVFAE